MQTLLKFLRALRAKLVGIVGPWPPKGGPRK